MSTKGLKDKIKSLKKKYPKAQDIVIAALLFAISFTIFFYLTRYFLSSQLNNF